MLEIDAMISSWEIVSVLWDLQSVEMQNMRFYHHPEYSVVLRILNLRQLHV